ncbi:AbiV family abortive infection protein [Granulicoccus sp. GXG6511]|uniref:AbiV family abortive infection protein n=1 Tax=Granulicoccus sp. GXG6511 TaxID=3381351 RepID=UPI003D7DC50A
MTPEVARAFWKALMDNASTLITDAHVLLESGSFGRARALTVLAQEELGKALWVYETFERAWSTGEQDPREVDELKKRGRDHVRKYAAAFVFSDELAEFWGDYGYFRQPDEGEEWEAAFERWAREADEAAGLANRQKQAGFYVDLSPDGTISAPSSIEAGSIAEDLQTAGQVIEMLLIKDHTRMKHDASTPYDSTHPQQFRLLPITHPEDWAAASETFRQSGGSPFPISGDD